MKLIELMNVRKTLPLDGKQAGIQTKYKIVKFLKASAVDAEFYESEVGKILSNCAEKTEDGKQIIQRENGIPIRDERKEEFVSKMAELENTEVKCPPLDLSLEEADQLDLTVENLLILDAFIKNDNEA